MDYLILGLATWRISNLLVNEDGPWDLLARLRWALGIRYDQTSRPYGTNVFSKLWTCLWCISPYIGVLLTFAYWRWSDLTLLLSLPFALSSMAVIVDRVANGSS
jgi:hypothetical protein